MLELAQKGAAALTAGCIVLACVGEPPPPLAFPADGGADANAADPCTRYCAEMAASCTGANQQYRTQDECKLACALLEPGSEQDREIDTIGCRINQARAGSCIAAGPFGGDVCGKHCDVFCAMDAKNCASQTPPPYPSASTCIEQCPSYVLAAGKDLSHTTSPSGDSFNCRAHHLILSLPADAKADHCPHTGATSATCRPDPAAHDGGADAH
jgi:hypothetical protein